MRKILSIVLIVIVCTEYASAQFNLTIVIEKKPQAHTADTIFVAGSFNAWNPSNTIFENGRTAIISNLKPGVYEFKFTRGSWSKVQCDIAGGDVPNHIVKLQSDTTVYLSIDGWKDDFRTTKKTSTASVNVKVLDSAFYLPLLKRTRTVRIYLPPDYGKSGKRFPVIYMHDAQNLFDAVTAPYGEWGVDEALDSMYNAKKFSCIVVGIDNGSRRLNEYNPFANKRFGVGEGNEYLSFIVHYLKPFIDKNFKTKSDKSNTAIAGSSMGGLISYYAALKYPQVFGIAGVFSPSFWIAPEMRNLTSAQAKSFNSKVFFYCGEMESSEMVSDMQNIVALLKSKTKAKTVTLIDNTGRHNEAYWRKVFPTFISFWRNAN